MKYNRILICLFCFLLIFQFLAGGNAYSQEKKKPAIKIGGGARIKLNRVDTTLYPTNFLNVTIISKDGKPIEGLTKDHFQVMEEGKEQKVLDVVQSDEKGAKLFIVLVIDASGSMGQAMDDTKAAAESFLDYLSPEDQVAILSFSNFYTLLCDFTSDRETLKTAIKSLKPMGGTALYSSTAKALTMFENIEEGNKVIIVLTDGRNNRPGAMEECINLSHANGVPIFTIGLGDSVDKTSLSLMASETGGMFRHAPTSGELEEVYKSLATQLKKQYWVKYAASPQKWPKSPSSVSIQLKNVIGAGGQQSSLRYIVPLQWWKLITAYILVELAWIP